MVSWNDKTREEFTLFNLWDEFVWAVCVSESCQYLTAIQTSRVGKQPLKPGGLLAQTHILLNVRIHSCRIFKLFVTWTSEDITVGMICVYVQLIQDTTAKSLFCVTFILLKHWSDVKWKLREFTDRSWWGERRHPRKMTTENRWDGAETDRKWTGGTNDTEEEKKLKHKGNNSKITKKKNCFFHASLLRK